MTTLRTRTIREVLGAPKTSLEVAMADDHIRRECARIQDTWSPSERQKRAGMLELRVDTQQMPDWLFADDDQDAAGI